MRTRPLRACGRWIRSIAYVALCSIALLSIALLSNASASDVKIDTVFKPGQLVHPDSAVTIQLQISNQGGAAASSHFLLIFISDTAKDSTYYSMELAGGSIAPGQEILINWPTGWIPPSQGPWLVELQLGATADSNEINNGYFEYFSVSQSCDETLEWRKGPAMKIIRNVSHWPDAATLQTMRPGDVIGFSVYVEDEDYLMQRCWCDDKQYSSARGPYADNVVYEWSLQGQGKLIQPPGSEKTAVMYQLPTCDDYLILTDVITLTVRNPDGKGADEIMTASIDVRVDFSTGVPTAIPVTVTVTPLTQNSDETIESVSNGNCYPEAPQWSTLEPLTTVIDYEVTEVPGLCPDYLVMVTAERSDVDSINLSCTPLFEGECNVETAVGMRVSDPVRYIWRELQAGGEIVGGTNGSTILFRKRRDVSGRPEATIIDSRTQSDDDPITKSAVLSVPSKPKAYAGVGDKTGVDFLGVEWGVSGFEGGGASLASELEDAGYDVIWDDSVSSSDLIAAVQDPCVQAVAICSHGAGGQMWLTGVGGYDPTGPLDLTLAATQGYQCDRLPYLRDLTVLGCEALMADWGSTMINGIARGFSGSKTLGALRWYALWTYDPLPPHNLTLE